jgi:biotin synthase
MSRLSKKEAVELINLPDEKSFDLIFEAGRAARKYKGNKVKLCSIVNARSGKCSENCMFCAQSAHHKAKIDVYPLISSGDIVGAAKNAVKESRSTCFGIVTSGKGIGTDRDVAVICDAVKKIKSGLKVNRCVSSGILTKDQLKRLKDSGLKKFHHNLETSKSFFPKMCTTHTFEDRVMTVKAAKSLGLDVCSGGIFGLGETPAQRVELAFQLKELDPVSIPINILNPIKGTRGEKLPVMMPLEVLRLLAVYRLIFPEKDIGIFGGREISLRSLQPLMFLGGANMTLIGNYLTTTGNSPQTDLQMIKDLGLKIEKVS